MGTSRYELCRLCLELNVVDGGQMCQLLSADWASFNQPHMNKIRQELNDNRGFKENCPWHSELFPPLKLTKRLAHNNKT